MIRPKKPVQQLILTGGQHDRHYPFYMVLTANELIAVGLVTTHWSLLEFSMDNQIVLLAHTLDITMPAGFWRKSLTQRLRGWRDIVQNEYPYDGYRSEAIETITIIGTIKNERDRITHHPWARTKEMREDKTIIISLGSENRQLLDWKFTERRILNIVDKITDVTDKLLLLAPGYEFAGRRA